LSLAAIFVGSRDHRTQFWKGAIQGPFHQSLVAIGLVVSEEKIKMWNVDGRTKSDDNSSHGLKARWAKNQPPNIKNMVSPPQPTVKKNGIPTLPGRLKWNSPYHNIFIHYISYNFLLKRRLNQMPEMHIKKFFSTRIGHNILSIVHWMTGVLINTHQVIYMYIRKHNWHIIDIQLIFQETEVFTVKSSWQILLKYLVFQLFSFERIWSRLF
jgi:hypothetical protein